MTKDGKLPNKFTLLEVVVTLMLLSILAAIIAPYYLTAIKGSPESILRLSTSLRIHAVAETINADYLLNYKTDLATLKNNIGSENSNQNNTYGIYTIVYNRYITFDDDGNEQNDTSGDNNLLKVTITNSQGTDSTTILFTLQQ